jgi:hypothetical protein
MGKIVEATTAWITNRDGFAEPVSVTVYKNGYTVLRYLNGTVTRLKRNHAAWVLKEYAA